MDTQMPHQLEARPFVADDVGRLIAWAGTERPFFMPEGDAASSVEAFMAVADQNEGQGRYLAVIDHNPLTGYPCLEDRRVKFNPARGLNDILPPQKSVIRGPIACLREFNGAVTPVYVDPIVKNCPEMLNAVEQLAQRLNRSNRLVAA